MQATVTSLGAGGTEGSCNMKKKHDGDDLDSPAALSLISTAKQYGALKMRR